MMPSYEPIEQRFIKYVVETDTCWVWIGSTDNCGYGRIAEFLNGVKKNYACTRWLWEYIFSPIPKGKVLCHTCDNPPCVRPDHLYVGTQRTNALDREQRGRGGKLSGKTFKLTKQDYEEIHRLYKQNVSVPTIAKIKQIHIRTVYRYLNGEKHVKHFSSIS